MHAPAETAHTSWNDVTRAVFHAPMFALKAVAEKNACDSTARGRRRREVLVHSVRMRVHPHTRARTHTHAWTHTSARMWCNVRLGDVLTYEEECVKDRVQLYKMYINTIQHTAHECTCIYMVMHQHTQNECAQMSNELESDRAMVTNLESF